ncbi:hypothetical protein Syun_010487 [Stephania yunnanensis]|uniref:F-box domain-containing protein n=1 Tax=Stephania yunnanensis TaxID=152371 RepID=A0AAP0KI52_9MAGN
MALDNSNGDGFSDLPDSILHQILSFLNIEYVVQTTALSSRWKDLWKSHHQLSFDKKITPKNHPFPNDLPHVYKWILAVHIEVSTKNTIRFPRIFVINAPKLLYLLMQTGVVNSSLSLYSCKVAFEPQAALKSLSLRFPNLKRLDLKARFSRDCALTIMLLLKTSPKIKTLKIEIVENGSTSTDNEEWWELELSNQCMFHHLEDVEVHGIVGCAAEVKLVEIMLKKATTLKRMVVCCSKKKAANNDWLMNLSKKLLRIPRASSNIALVII